MKTKMPAIAVIFAASANLVSAQGVESATTPVNPTSISVSPGQEGVFRPAANPALVGAVNLGPVLGGLAAFGGLSSLFALTRGTSSTVSTTD